MGAADRYSSGFWNKSIQNVGVQWFYIKLSCVLPLNAKLMDPKRMQRVAKEGAVPMSTREIVHTINNQLTIVMGRAALMAETAEDPGTRSRCKEIQSAVQTISRLINRMQQE